MPATETGIVVLGVPRSGTTLVRRVLNAHPRVACPAETCVLSACARFLHNEIVADGLDYGAVSGLSFAGFDEGEVIRRLRHFAFGFHQEFARRHGKARWAEKTAVDVFHLNEIEQLCGDEVQYVCIVRHGLDVVCSLEEFSNRGHTFLSELHEYVKRFPRTLEAFAHAWVDANQALCDLIQRKPKQCILIRYEDLIDDPKATVSKLMSFLNEDYDDELLIKAMQRPDSLGFGDWKTYSRQEIVNTSLHRWKSLPPATVSRLAEICNPILEVLGYPPESLHASESQAAARRRFEFSLIFGANKDDV